MSKKAEKLYNGMTNIDTDIIEEAEERYASKKPPVRVWKYAGIAASIAVVLSAGLFAVTNLPSLGGSGNVNNFDGETAGQVTTAPPTAAIPTEAPKETTIAGDVTEPPLTTNTNWVTLPLEYLASPDTAAEQLMEVEYPYIPQYTNKPEDQKKFDEMYKAWREHCNELRDNRTDYSAGLDGFFADSIKTFLTGSAGKNMVYSPTSLYMALGMSAEITGGSSRQQILDLLGYSNIEELRKSADRIWYANYMDDGMAKCLLANSLWLNNDITYTDRAVRILADFYKASSFIGEPGTAQYDELYRQWLSEQTGGQLDSYVNGLSLDPLMIITLASTVDYCGKWMNRFDKNATYSDTFHTPDKNVDCDYLYRKGNDTYWWGDKFSAIALHLENNGYMLLMLPDEGVTPEELLNDKQAMDFMMNDPYDLENHKYAEVELSLPKFDISSGLDLSEGLKQLGITDIFDPQTADLHELTDAVNVALGEAKQAARVQIDEEGCKASALTIMSYCGAAMPDGSVEMKFDRPFVFEIVGESRMPLFVGIVNDPAAN